MKNHLKYVFSENFEKRVVFFEHRGNNQINSIFVHIRTGQMSPSEVIVLNIKDFFACTTPVIEFNTFFSGWVTDTKLIISLFPKTDTIKFIIYKRNSCKRSNVVWNFLYVYPLKIHFILLWQSPKLVKIFQTAKRRKCLYDSVLLLFKEI